jgi:4'-phosphopantetheinyl transferase
VHRESIQFERCSPAERLVAPLNRGEMHIWAIRLDAQLSELDDLASILGPEERLRAQRFIFPQHRRRYTICHAYLRRILSAYTGSTPNRLSFSIGPYGKPELAEDNGIQPIHFNLAHSGDFALVGIALSPIGVDIEQLRDLGDLRSIAGRIFHPGEAQAILSLPGDQVREAFFRCWTRKEAVIKALGTGLSMPLDRFQVTVDCERPPMVLDCDTTCFTGQQWYLSHFEPASGTIGAAAVGFPPVKIRAVLIE